MMLFYSPAAPWRTTAAAPGNVILLADRNGRAARFARRPKPPHRPWSALNSVPPTERVSPLEPHAGGEALPLFPPRSLSVLRREVKASRERGSAPPKPGLTSRQGGARNLYQENLERGILVDEQDSWLLGEFVWRVGDRGYVFRREPVTGKRLSLHRIILQPKQCELVDHINGVKHDNRRSNLRIANESLNSQNLTRVSRRSTTKLRNVYYYGHLAERPWKAQVFLGGKHHFLGYYATAHEAAHIAHVWRFENMPGATG
jgi:hypothetical protein